MLIPFEELAPHSRIWVYQANRLLSAEDQQHIHDAATQFLSGWQAHGKDLRSSFSIAYDQFLIIGVDEQYNMATGCSIDASVHLIKNLEQSLGLNFFDRMQIPFLQEGKVSLLPMQQIPAQVEAGTLNPDSLTFNNLVKNKAEFDSNWKVAAKDSWLSRYF